jgi:hypothetical protein
MLAFALLVEALRAGGSGNGTERALVRKNHPLATKVRSGRYRPEGQRPL